MVMPGNSGGNGGASSSAHVPYVSADESMPELTFRAVFLGVLMAIALGAANAYLGMKVGLTVAATFPAAVVAMAVLRLFKGNILEENLARTTASVGEALVAGAIFTIPAFVIAGVWDNFHYVESMVIMMIGGILGVLFIVILRRTLVVEADLPFPESIAAAEIVKAGQGGQTGAKYVFMAMGLGALWELVKNSNGIQIVAAQTQGWWELGRSSITMFKDHAEQVVTKLSYSGGMMLESPAASPSLMGVGYIVGTRISAVLFAGAVFGWWLLVPLALFLNPDLKQLVSGAAANIDISNEVWKTQIRPLAVGTMIVSAFYTLYNLKDKLVTGIGKAVRDLGSGLEGGETNRLDHDINFKYVGLAILAMAVPTFFLYDFFSHSIMGSLVLTVVMIILGFLFVAVAGYLVGLIGSSNNPISGLTLSSLLIAAVLMVSMGVTGPAGVAGVLGVAGVVCCAAGIGGDMMQDLKVGHILGGTPSKMQIGELIGVVIAALTMPFVLFLLHKAYVIGSVDLPAPQAGLMALMANGIVGGEMAWPLVIFGMLMGLGLILIKAPAPMLIAVGMYLPFHSTSAIFVGGVIRWIFDRSLARRNPTPEQKMTAENTGILISSGFIAGESLMAVALALMLFFLDFFESSWTLPKIGEYWWLGLIAFIGVGYLLNKIPLGRIDRAE